MRFEKDIHWFEGLFLQPHHLQRLQRNQKLRIHHERVLNHAFPYGLIELEIDPDALTNYRVVVTKLSAVMPSGEEVSLAGNSALAPLDVATEIEATRDEFIVYLALPLWNDYEANQIVDDQQISKRQFTIQEAQVRDENTGDNEIIMSYHRMNLRLTTDAANNSDLELLPLLRLRPLFSETAAPVLEVDTDFVPPYLVVSEDCPLLGKALELNCQLEKRRNKILQDLTASGYTTEALSGLTLHAILQLRTLNHYVGRLKSLLVPGRITPFELYLELKSLLGELAALHPMRGLEEVSEYQHLNPAPAFQELLVHIRSLIMAEGVSSYVRLEFTPNTQGPGRVLQLDRHQINEADDFYLAVRCDSDLRQTINAIETGDNFKLVNPASGNSRIRGVKLVEMRYPPRFLPALTNAVWFQLDRKSSPRVWQEICNEEGILLDWVEDIFPKLEVALYITILTQRNNQQ